MMHRPIQATILTQNLRDNLRLAKNICRQSSSWAVVKANAYGHTIEAALQGFSESEGLALLELESAGLARKLRWQK